MKFSTRIKEKRQELGWTQSAVATKLFVTRQTISNWEQGKSYPDLSTLVKLSDMYHISIDSLLKGDSQLKNHLDQGRAYNAFSVLRGLIFILYGLFFLIIDQLSYSSLTTEFCIFAFVIIFCIACLYGEHVKPFFLGMDKSKYNRKGHRPDQRASLINKILCVLLIMIIITMVIMHSVVSDYLLTLALTIIGFMNIFQKYMWKQF